MGKKRLFEHLAEEIEQEIAQNPDKPLPSIAELARQKNVSSKTMWKAVQHLAGQGKLHTSRGKKISVAAADGAPIPPDTSVSSLFEKIESRILDGTYIAGEPLPKFSYFSLTDRVSPTTVSQAFRLLGEKNLAHKQGRQWIAGPAQKLKKDALPGSTSELPVILLLVRREYDWFQLFHWMHTASFAVHFRDEIAKHGIQLSLAVAEESDTSAIAHGEKRIHEQIQTLGKRYKGTIAIFSAHAAHESIYWIKRFGAYKKPVVLFDYNDETQKQWLALEQKRSPAFRMHFDHESAVRAALETLANLGHTTIGVPHYKHKGYEWTDERVEMIKKVASESKPSPRIIIAEHGEGFWDFPDQSSVNQFVDRISRYSEGSYKKKIRPSLQKMFIENTPSMVKLIREGATAIVALSDRMARDYYFWFKSIGVEIPRHLSLISFDNVPDSITFPISTIDFGFARLGYLAAHIFIDDFSVWGDAHGNIAGECVLMDRGSLGGPPRSEIDIRRLLHI